MSKNGNQAVKAGLAYTIGNVLIRGINFITLPIFSRLMTTEEFGVYNVFLSYESILYVIVGLALHSSIRSAKIEFKEEIDSYTSSISLVYILNLAILVIASLLFSTQISELLRFENRYILLLCLYAFASAIITLYNERLALDYSYKKYLIISFINSVGNIALSLVLLLTVFSNDKSFGRIIGVTIIGLLLSVYIICSFFKAAKPNFNKRFLKFGIRYSLPIIPHGISQVLLSQYDRIMIKDIIGNAAAGIFSLATNLKLILTIVTASVSSAWSTWFYEQIEQREYENIKSRAKLILVLFLTITIGLIFVSPEMIMLLGGEKYLQARYVAVPIICDAFFLAAYNIIVPAEYYKEKTTYIMLGTIVAAIIDIVLNSIFIPRYGFVAAAYTTLFAYFIYLIMHMVIVRKIIGFDIISVRFLSGTIGLLLICAVICLIAMELFLLRYLACFLYILCTFLILRKKTNIKELLTIIKK